MANDQSIGQYTAATAKDDKADFFPYVDNSESDLSKKNKRIDFSIALDWLRTSTAASVSSANEVIIGVTDTSSVRTVTIQTADIRDGKLFIIKDESGAAGTNNITVASQGSETFDGAGTLTISTNYGVQRLYSDGTDLFTF